MNGVGIVFWFGVLIGAWIGTFTGLAIAALLRAAADAGTPPITVRGDILDLSDWRAEERVRRAAVDASGQGRA